MAYDADSIFELVDTVPLGTESKSFGDDAIREIKKVLKTSFPNSPIDDVYTGTLAELSALANGQTLPRDAVIMYANNELDGPEGWTICDGRPRKSGGGNAPDLRGIFVIGAKAFNDPQLFTPLLGDSRGNHETVIRDLTTTSLVEFTTKGHLLTEQQLPAHSHELFKGTGSSEGNAQAGEAVAQLGITGGYDNYAMQKTSELVGYVGESSTVGGNQSHTHDFEIDTTGKLTGSNIPLSYALLYIIKD
jgi:microcystin-dependent protein